MTDKSAFLDIRTSGVGHSEDIRECASQNRRSVKVSCFDTLNPRAVLLATLGSWVLSRQSRRRVLVGS